jgi:hypothetical protein
MRLSPANLVCFACVLFTGTAAPAQFDTAEYEVPSEYVMPHLVTQDDGFLALSGLDLDYHTIFPHSGFEADLWKTGQGARIGGFVPFGPVCDGPFDGTIVTGLDGRFSYTHFSPRPNVVLNLPGVGDFRLDNTDLYLFRPGVGAWWYRPVTENTLGGIGLVGGLMVGQVQSRISAGTYSQVDRLIISDVPLSRAFFWGGDVEIGLRLVNPSAGWGITAHGSYGGYSTNGITGYSHGGGFFSAGLGITLYPEILFGR